MATITLTIADAIMPDLVDALCIAGGYQASSTSPDGTVTPNPMTKGQYAKHVLVMSLKARYRDYMDDERRKALVPIPDPDIS